MFRKIISEIQNFLKTHDNVELKNDLPIKEIQKFKTPKNIEPSGIIIDQFNNVLVISDNGYLLKNNEEVIKIKKDKDYEAITIDNQNNLYIIEEGKDKLVSIDEDYKIIDEVKVERKI